MEGKRGGETEDRKGRWKQKERNKDTKKREGGKKDRMDEEKGEERR